MAYDWSDLSPAEAQVVHDEESKEPPQEAPNSLLSRALRLFDFLTRVQMLTARPVRDLGSYKKDGGAVIWLRDVPAHDGFQVGWSADLEPDDPVLSIERVSRFDPPKPPRPLIPWVSGRLDDPTSQPSLMDSVFEPSDMGADEWEQAGTTRRIEDHPDIRLAFSGWVESWEAWCSREIADARARGFYNELFRVYIEQRNAPEEWELVVGVGVLGWLPDRQTPVLRHLLVHELVLEFDDDSGKIVLRQDPDAALTIDLDMLDPNDWPDQVRLQELKEAASEYSDHVLSRDTIADLARRIVHNLSSDSRYVDDEGPPSPSDGATCAFAPAIILRPRTHRGLIDIFQTISAQLQAKQEVPAGLRVLLDPDQATSATEPFDAEEGAWVTDGPEVYLPLPVNDRQLEVIRRVDRRPMTLVQGPPGTGKTHTAAALISHLLAQGKRVLVTAQTDRALKELRGQLPEEIRDLSVSIVGSGRDDLADLRVAVRVLSERAGDYDDSSVATATEDVTLKIADVRKRKATVARSLLEGRERETHQYERSEMTGTLAQIASKHHANEEAFGWLEPMCRPGVGDPAPLSSREATELLRLLRDEGIARDESESAQDLPSLDDLSSPETFAQLVEAARAADERSRAYEELRGDKAFDSVSGLLEGERSDLRSRVDALARRADELSHRNEPWLSLALDDVRNGKLRPWTSRGEQVAELISKASPSVESVGPLADVRINGGDLPLLRELAEALRAFLASGKRLAIDNRTRAPRIGLLDRKVVKDAQPVFVAVTVNGLPPSTEELLAVFIAWADAVNCLDALDRAWPADVTTPAEDSVAERLAWHVAEMRILEAVVALGEDLAAEEGRLQELGVPKPDWRDLEGVARFARLVDAAASFEARQAASGPLEELGHRLEEMSRWYDAAPVVHALASAVDGRNPTDYRLAFERLRDLEAVASRAARRDALRSRLSIGADGVARVLVDSITDMAWDERLERFEEAWEWAETAAWIRGRDDIDVNALQRQYNDLEDEMHIQVSRMAALRAWSKAVMRLGPTQRADLTQYSQLVQRFGRTGGKYRERKLAGMRDAMERCRPAVPVWIMPIYRIAQSLQVDADLFDVVVVDEASQAGLEATFLQYLAPRIVVIGDDKQVSPRAVGVDHSELQGLADQFLFDDRFKASWEDPKRSLFDEARMRFGDLITLVEHRRCVPDIIGFSNRVAYEPENIRLIPVRQAGNDALDPVVPCLVVDGFTRGETNRVNEPEAQALVEQVEKCLADSRYDGLSFGVISLTGPYQAKLIEKSLMERIDSREWESRDLRCGTAPDFQGSERDVMFLSMVAALGDGRRYAPLTGDMYVQQFNVAASRARDQMWIFHSLASEELSNHDDMRFQLLDYAYGVKRRREEGADGRTTSPVPEDRKVPPFDSMFEQRVHNRIFDRGFTVIPQFEVGPRRIDLVVLGARGRLAVECDGDEWHGPEQYERDLARQRELQRCGWQFFRVRESEFNIDSARALLPLWDLLDELEIEAPTSDRSPSAVTSVPPAVPPSAAPAPLADVLEQPMTQTPLPPPEVIEPETVQASATSEAGMAESTSTAVSMGMSQPEPGLVESHQLSRAGSRSFLPPYSAGDTGRRLPDPQTATPSELEDGLLQIVAVEGPVVGQRLYQLYVASAGGLRVGSGIKRVLNQASSAAERAGRLKADNPLSDAGQIVKTFRLPAQDHVIARELGPRVLHDVPPAELAALLRDIRQDGEGREELFRRLLNEYGLTRLTTATRQRLEACLQLAD